MRDYQRSKVYGWQQRYFCDDRPPLNLDDCKALARVMYGAKVVVKDGRGRTSACAIRGGKHHCATIKLPCWARTPWVIAHEVAHLLNPKGAAAHGGNFMWWYLLLLSEFAEHDYDALEASAISFGLRVTEP